jgi:20S proteasome alpha/beta subunit
MTCIVGIIDKKNKTILMGADSAGVSGFNIRSRKDPKVFVRYPFIMGFTTSFRMGQLLMSDERFRIRKQNQHEPDFDYMVSAFIPSVQTLFKEGEYVNTNEKEKEKGLRGGTFLVGYKEHLYCIESDFQVAEHNDDYSACGCGENYALGSLFSTASTNMTPADRLYKALKTAEYFSSGVIGPFTMLTLKYE